MERRVRAVFAGILRLSQRRSGRARSAQWLGHFRRRSWRRRLLVLLEGRIARAGYAALGTGVEDVGLEVRPGTGRPGHPRRRRRGPKAARRAADLVRRHAGRWLDRRRRTGPRRIAGNRRLYGRRPRSAQHGAAAGLWRSASSPACAGGNGSPRSSSDALAVTASGLLSPRRAAGAGGVSVDASATGTGASGLTFSHTMGAGANGLLVVGVVVPITCDDHHQRRNNCGACGATCAQDVGGVPQHRAARPLALRRGKRQHLRRFVRETATPPRSSTAPAGPLATPATPWRETAPTATCRPASGPGSARTTRCRSPPGPTSTPTPTARSSGISGTNGWNMPFLSVKGSTVYGWLWGVPGTNSTHEPAVSDGQPRRLALPGHHLRSQWRRRGRRQGDLLRRRRRLGVGHREPILPRERPTRSGPSSAAPSRRRSPTAISSARSTRCAPTIGR